MERECEGEPCVCVCLLTCLSSPTFSRDEDALVLCLSLHVPIGRVRYGIPAHREGSRRSGGQVIPQHNHNGVEDIPTSSTDIASLFSFGQP